MSWPLIRRARFFAWCVLQAASMATGSRGALHVEGRQRMRADPLVPKAHTPKPPEPLLVLSVAGAFGLADTPTNRAAAMLHSVGGFGTRAPDDPQA